MKISKVKELKNYMSILDLEAGDCFRFLNSDGVYIHGGGCLYTDLGTGEQLEIDADIDEDLSPSVELLDAEIIIY